MKKKVKRYQEGGEAEEKRRGLKASEGERVGFLERLRMGNIDDPTSEAYKRFGAGRGRSMPAPDMTPYSETEDAKNLMKAARREMTQADTAESGIGRYAREKGSGEMRSTPSRSATTPRASKSTPAKEKPKASPRGSFRGTQEEGNEGEELARAAMRPRVTDTGDETDRLSKRDVKRDTGPRVQRPGFIRRALARLGGAKLPQESYGVDTEDEMPAARPRPYSTAGAIAGKNMGFKKGGMVSSGASKRADGIAKRGKTRGRIV
jgi:hypothetical protein